MINIDFEKELNTEQYAVVSAEAGPHLVLAGAGSGKTRTLVYRVAWLLAKNVSPEKILLVTFTNKASSEMIARVKSLLHLPQDQKLSLWAGTFHSLASRLLRIYGEAVGVPRDFSIMDEDDKKALLKNIIKEIFGSLDIKRLPSPSIVNEVISFASNSQITIAESLERKFPDWQPLQDYFEKIKVEFDKRKTAAKLLDFDDLLLYWYRLTEDPHVGQVLAKKWEHVLVDEYQDTNTLQAKIIFNLAKEHKNILVVGDDAQSIYSFRAANIQNIFDFPEVFANCQVHKLEINYRSTPEIVELANAVIASNTKQFAKNLQAVIPKYIKPELIAIKTNREEASFIADRIQGLLADGLEPSDIAVLFRATHHSQYLEMELNRRQIAYELRGGMKFFERAHVKDVLAWLRVLYNLHDEISWRRILQLYEGVGPAAAQKIYEAIVSQGNLELRTLNIRLSQSAQKSFSYITAALEKMLIRKDSNLLELLEIIIDEYTAYLKSTYTDFYDRMEDLEQLKLFASNYQDLNTFLTEITLQEQFAEVNSGNKRNNIVLSTVHQAKGLEWQAVFIMNLTDESFPHPMAVSEEEQEEERRLFYVAVTRAKKQLYLVYPMANLSFSGFKVLQPSEFLADLDGRLLNYNQLAKSTAWKSDGDVQYVAEFDDGVADSDGFLPDVSEW